MNKTAQLEVYTDGQCPLCRWSRERVEERDRDRRVVWFDFHDPEAQTRATPHTVQQLSEEMHVRRLSDGAWLKGYEAWLEVLAVLPRWRVVVGALKVWPFRSFGPIFYRRLARSRYKLFGIPPPCGADGACALHAPKN